MKTYKNEYSTRFAEVLHLLFGAYPDQDAVYKWVNGIDSGGRYELQEWVINQQNIPKWCEGIVILEAVGYMVDNARYL